MNISNNILAFCKDIKENGGLALIVGGAVRDFVLRKDNDPKDIDIEIYKLSLEKIVFIAGQHADRRLNLVGASFGVIKCQIDGVDIDMSLPRLDNKVGKGHKGFIPEFKSDLTVEQAAARRDFTINAMAYCPIDRKLIDPFMGESDGKRFRLVPTSPAFMEDSLRVLRGMQFAGRFGYNASIETREMAKRMIDEYGELATERIWGEWEKWASKSLIPSAGLDFLLDCGWLKLYPEIADLVGVQQDKEWHPEGDVYEHTCHVVDAMAIICSREKISGERKLVLMFAALCHDMGKPSTTTNESGRWKAPKHDKAGVPLAESFLKSIGCPAKIIEKVLPLVSEHMAHISLIESDRTVRRLAMRLHPANVNDLALVVAADMSGRPPLKPDNHPRIERILEIAKKLEIENNKPVPLIKGRHLLQLGYKEGPELGERLKFLFEKQLEGVFDTIDKGLLYEENPECFETWS